MTERRLTTKKIGNIGENIACKYLKRKKYQILGRNEYFGKAELDIIAKIKEKIVFIEVKTIYQGKFKNIEFMVNEKKYEMLLLGIQRYLTKNHLNNDFQLDLIIVEIAEDNKLANIKHYPEIF